MLEAYRIAIADNDPKDRERIRSYLESNGHRVVAEANSSEELISLYEETNPDLVIADISTEASDDLDALKTILETNELPVIVCSASHSEEYLERANKYHALAYLIKPIREEALCMSVQLAMNRFGEIQHYLKEVTDMRQALEDRKSIEKAKEILANKLATDEATAFRHLQQTARNKRKKMIEVAQSIILAEEAFNGDQQVG